MASKGGKAVVSRIRLLIGAGGAKPAPPVGPALGQAGLNIMAFCKDFNAATSGIKVWRRERERRRKGGGERARHTTDPRLPVPCSPSQDGVPIPVTITAYSDKSYDYVRDGKEKRRGEQER